MGWTRLTVNNPDPDERAGRRKRAHAGQRPLWAPEDRDRRGQGLRGRGTRRTDARPPTREMERGAWLAVRRACHS